MTGRECKRRTLHESYSWHHSMEDVVCEYCGVYGDVQDHVPPLSVVYMSPEDYGKRMLVRSCGECNSLLGDQCREFSISGRRSYLLSRYKSRYRNLLLMPAWTQEQLSELGPILKQYIGNDAALKRHIRARLEKLGGSGWYRQ